MASSVGDKLDRWEAIFAHWLVPSAVVAACAAAALSHRIPLTAIAHSGDVHLVCKLGIASAVARILRAHNAHLVFVSHALRKRFLAAIRSGQLLDWVRARSTVTPMGIDVAHFMRLRGQPPPLKQPFRILFLGRLVPIKGLDILLQAIARLQSSGPPLPVHLTVAGDGPCRTALEHTARLIDKRARTTIEFVGEVPPQRRDELLAQAHVLVLPSIPRPDGRTEGMPVTALEAMAAGVPLIASRTGGLDELPDQVATLVPAAQPAALARAIRECHRDPIAREGQIAAATDFVQRRDWDRVGPRLWPGFIDPTTGK